MSDKKDIIVFSTFLSNGGAERVLAELMNEWVSCGHKVQLMLIRNDVHGKNYPLDDRINVRRVVSKHKNRILRRIDDLSSVRKLIMENPRSVLISFDLSTQLLLGISKLFYKNKVVFSERNDPRRYPTKGFQRKARDIVFRFADICVFQTKEAMELFEGIKKGIVIPNPIGKNLPDLYEGNRRHVISAVCQLEERKNIPMLVDAFAKIEKKFPDYSVEIYGKGKDEENIRAYIETRGLTEKVKLMGFSHNVKEEIVDSAMYVSTSDYEGISNSMIEALAMGIPSICTDCPIYGARAMIKDGVNGFLIPVGDVDMLADRMRYIIEHVDKSEELSKAAFTIRELYPVEMVAGKWLELM